MYANIKPLLVQLYLMLDDIKIPSNSSPMSWKPHSMKNIFPIVHRPWLEDSKEYGTAGIISECRCGQVGWQGISPRRQVNRFHGNCWPDPYKNRQNEWLPIPLPCWESPSGEQLHASEMIDVRGYRRPWIFWSCSAAKEGLTNSSISNTKFSKIVALPLLFVE